MEKDYRRPLLPRELGEFRHNFFSSEGGKLCVLTVVSTITMVCYMYLNNGSTVDPHSVFPGLTGDFSAYALRFVLSFLLLGAVPLAVARALGYRISDLGIRWPKGVFKKPYFWVLLVVFAGVGASSAFNQPLYEFYPFSKSLVPAVRDNAAMFGLHAGAYLVFYYIPWELLFRGIMILPFLALVRRADSESWHLDPACLAVACVQIIPTTLMHLPHPMSESLSAILFGLVAAVLVLRYRSIVPGLILHFATGICLDATIILRHLAQ